MLLRRPAAILFAALCLASCDNPAGSDPDPKPVATPLPAKLEVVSGGGQQATVGQELPQPLVVRLLDDRGRPVRNHIVNFRVIAGGGTVFAGAALTNDDGEARERWTLGTVARDTQRVEARAVDPATGQPLVFGTFTGLGVADAPANVAPVGPAALTGSPGAAMPVAVRVQDRFGNRVAGATVAWQAPQGEGTVTPTQGVTDSTGVAAAQWTLAYSVGAQTMTAFAGTSLSTQFTAAAETPEGSRLVVVSGGEQLAAAGTALQPLVVRLQNAAGQPIRNAAVAWAVSGGEINPGSAVTDAQGQVTASWTPGTTAGPRTATASAAGASSAVFTAGVTAAAPAELRKVSGDGQAAFTGAELPAGARVAVVDAYGNAVPGREVRWRVVSGGGSVSPAAALTGADGHTEARWTLGATTGQQALAAESGSLGAQFVATATATPPPPPPPAPTVRIVSPAEGSRVGDSFRISATAVSDEGVTAVTATVADRSFPLALADGEWSGTVSFARLPSGSQTVTVSARSTSGVVGTASATYLHEVPPPAAVVIVSPADGSLVDDSFPMSVTATSSEEVTGVTATVAGRSFPFAFSADRWSGTVSFAGLAGSHMVTVTARSASGVVGTASATYTRDVPPAVTVESPVSFQVASPSVRVKAACADDAPAGCASLVVRLAGTGTVLAQGTSSVDATVSLAAHDGKQLKLEFVGRDSNGQVTVFKRDVYVETSAAWSNPAHGPGVLLDADAGRLLAADGEKLLVQTRSTGAVQTIFQETGTAFIDGFLTARGAIFTEGPDVLNRRVRDWRDGAIVTFDSRFVTMLKVAGNWALWHQNNTTLIRRDLQAGTNVVVSASAGNSYNDVAANGDVVFWTGSTYDLFRYRAGTTTGLTSTADPLWNVGPLTDGTAVVYRKQDPCCDGNSRIMMIGASGGEVPLSDPNPEQLEPGTGYQVAGGWIAFTRVGPTGVRQVWRRAPDGTITQITTAAAHSFVVTLGANGDLVFARGVQRFAVRPGGSPVAIGHQWGRPVWIGGVLHNILGASLFRITY